MAARLNERTVREQKKRVNGYGRTTPSDRHTPDQTTQKNNKADRTSKNLPNPLTTQFPKCAIQESLLHVLFATLQLNQNSIYDDNSNNSGNNRYWYFTSM